ncbi:MAG TPA: hypothetical protein DFR83_07485 [Deltaproteobacteria bacterium]|nr:hypothetical protein [Deltaproteobacteria bacterium]
MALSIPLPILLGLVAGGLVSTIGVLHAIGWSESARLEDADAVRRILSTHHPDDTVIDVLVAMDGASALALFHTQTLALVSVLGDRFVVRKLPPGSVLRLHIEPTQVVLVFRDVSFPRLTLALPEGPERARWTPRLTACATPALAS